VTTVLAVAHGETAAERAAVLFDGRAGVRILQPGRRGGGWRRAFAQVLVRRPGVLYLVDVGVVTAAASVAAVLVRVPFVVDTGDLVYELERSRGRRSPLNLFVVRVAEAWMLRRAAHVVVRGREHDRHVPRTPTTFAPDFAPPGTRPVDGGAVRRALGIEDRFVVGLVGSLHRAPARGVTYGSDLIDALPATPENVVALVVGDGDALPDLERRARELAVDARVRFVGRIPSAEVASYIGAMDVAISTQSNDAVGAVRTTGKLPLYLASGCPVIATHVGEAARLLGPLGWTLPYEGSLDAGYPARLAAAITELATRDDQAERRAAALELHEREFDVARIRARVQAVVDGLAT
jgi:glycosyltransferase involved in cell wall biosynthesis